jgi:N-acetylmuramoyl-L-alanine amidase
VFLTRMGDHRVSLPLRIQTAQRTGADLFLSLHCGRSTRADQRGVKVFYSRGDELSQAWAELVANALQQRLQGRTTAHGARPLHWRRRAGAARLLKAVRAQMPACRVELGFLSHPHDARLLQDRRYLDDLARGLAAAALAWGQDRDGLFTTETRRHGEVSQGWTG